MKELWRVLLESTKSVPSNYFNPMKIKGDSKLSFSSGSFGTKIENGVLLVPKFVEKFACDHYIVTAGELLGFGQSCPSVVMEVFEWSEVDANQALALLREQLKG